MSRSTGATDAELGARLARALERRVGDIGVPSAPHLDRVRAGARRRRRNARTAIGAACATALLITGAAIAVRTTEDTRPAAPTTTVPAPPPMLPAYAMLTDDTGALVMPVSSYATRGGTAFGAALPAIDVWQRDGQTLVVRTVDETPPAGGETTPPADATVATTAAPASQDLQPWRDRTVTRLSIRGVSGAIEELADDQFAVWIPQESAQRYTVVIGRGMSRDALIDAVTGLVERDGVLEPADGFVAVERVAAAPATTPTMPYVQLAYASPGGAADPATGFAVATSWVATSLVPAGRSTIETMPLYDIGRIEEIDGRSVVVTEAYQQRSVAWLDPSGTQVMAWTRDAGMSLDDLVAGVRMASEAEWMLAQRRTSAEIETTVPAQGDYTAGGVDLELRIDEPVRALCVTVAETTECAAIVVEDPEPGMAVRADADIAGRWIIAGYWEGSENEVSMADMSFVDAAGNSVATVDWTYRDGAYWFIARIADGVDVVTTNLGNIVGGPVGQLVRPVGISVSA